MYISQMTKLIGFKSLIILNIATCQGRFCLGNFRNFCPGLSSASAFHSLIVFIQSAHSMKYRNPRKMIKTVTAKNLSDKGQTMPQIGDKMEEVGEENEGPISELASSHLG